jgi:hypothetical protein
VCSDSELGGTTCTLTLEGGLAAGDSGTVQLVVQVADSLPSPTWRLYTSGHIADDGAAGEDMNRYNNSASETTEVASEDGDRFRNGLFGWFGDWMWRRRR